MVWLTVICLLPEIFGKEKGCRSTAFPLPFSWGDLFLPPLAVLFQAQLAGFAPYDSGK
jgi:hypothetical protein